MCTQVYSLCYKHISKYVVYHYGVVPTNWINKVVRPLPTCEFPTVPMTGDLNIIMADATPDKIVWDFTRSRRWTYDSAMSCILRLFGVIFQQCFDVFDPFRYIFQLNARLLSGTSYFPFSLPLN